MQADTTDVLRKTFLDAIAAHEQFAKSKLGTIAAAAEVISQAIAAGRKVVAFGNGGSAADAQHFVAELVGRFEKERRALPAIAFTTNTSVVTAIANDYAYDRVFVRQVEALCVAGDVALGISTSGGSPNVEAGLTAAKALGVTTIALTGRDGGRVGAAADIHVNVASNSTPRVQEVQRTIMHAMCSLIENSVVAG